MYKRNELLERVSYLSKDSIDIHCHGVGVYDFTEISDLNLEHINNILKERQEKKILTIYLPKQNFDEFILFMNKFWDGKCKGEYSHIIGISLEGPLLASHGGTPEIGVWQPTKKEWEKIANCGKLGLIYVIFSPDASMKNEKIYPESTLWIAQALFEKQVLPAAGHFLKSNPADSALRLKDIYQYIENNDGMTITDHLYNDMPHNFKHAWRTPEEKNNRNQELKAQNIDQWQLDNLEDCLGLVPATMIRYAKKGILKIAMNFDGEHLDLAIVKRTVELLGAENILMMTDSIESKKLAGRKLEVKNYNNLLYQNTGIVAAGTSNVNRQIQNMVEIGLSDEQINKITKQNPLIFLSQFSRASHAEISCV